MPGYRERSQQHTRYLVSKIRKQEQKNGLNESSGHNITAQQISHLLYIVMRQEESTGRQRNTSYLTRKAQQESTTRQKSIYTRTWREKRKTIPGTWYLVCSSKGRKLRARINEKLFGDTPPILFSFDLICIYIVDRKVNHQADVLTFDSKNERQTNPKRRLLGLVLLFVLLNLGSSSDSTWHVPGTEGSHANVSRVVDCFTGETHHSRETGPPNQPQPEVRGPTAPSTE